MVERHVIADLRRLANDHPHAVIDEKLAADLRSGMDFNPGQEPADVRYETPKEKKLVTPEPVGDAVDPEGMKSRIAEDDLQGTACRRVTIKNRIDIFSKALEHGKHLVIRWETD